VRATLGRLERLAQPLNRSRVQLRHPRLVHPQLGADLLHRHLAVVVEPDQLALAGRQRRDGGADAIVDLGARVRRIRSLGLGGDERGWQRGFVEVIGGGERRGGFDRVDAEDGAVQALLVGAHLGRKVRHRRLVAQFAAEGLAGGLELAALAAHAARPRLAPERVDHRAADAPLRECLELDAALLVEPVGRVDQAQHAVLHQVADVDRVRHRRGKSPRQRFDEGKAGNNAAALVGGNRMGLHLRTPSGVCRCLAPNRVLPVRGVAAHPFATAVPERHTLPASAALSSSAAVTRYVSNCYSAGTPEIGAAAACVNPRRSVKMLTQSPKGAAKTVTDEPGL